jgi:hypothetical protein
VLPTDPPPVDPPSPAAGESNPWETAAVRVAYRDGFILCAPGTDPAPLIEALDEHRQPREWAAFGAELAAHGPHRARLAMLVARAVAARGMSPEEEDQLAAWLTRIIVDVIVRVGGVHGVIAWLARTALREERVVATC